MEALVPVQALCGIPWWVPQGPEALAWCLLRAPEHLLDALRPDPRCSPRAVAGSRACPGSLSQAAPVPPGPGTTSRARREGGEQPPGLPSALHPLGPQAEQSSGEGAKAAGGWKEQGLCPELLGRGCRLACNTQGVCVPVRVGGESRSQEDRGSPGLSSPAQSPTSVRAPLFLFFLFLFFFFVLFRTASVAYAGSQA